MNSSARKALLALGGCVIAVVLLLAADAVIAVDRMNPVPTADAAAAKAGWGAWPSYVRSVEASGGLFGSTAVVKYAIADAEASELRSVRLRRPLLAGHWQVVSIDPK
jgi:hypothetical protein